MTADRSPMSMPSSSVGVQDSTFGSLYLVPSRKARSTCSRWARVIAPMCSAVTTLYGSALAYRSR